MTNRPLLRTCFIMATFLLSQHIGAQAPPTAPPAGTTPPAAAPTPAPAAPAPSPGRDGYVKVGSTMKPSRGRVIDVDKGDNGCYLSISDEKKSEYIEVGSFALCTQKPPVKGKRVEVEYTMETIMAGDCYGDPKCKRTETVPYITSVKIID